jgi:hypothetical protein
MKFEQRIINEFEEILLKLSQNTNATYEDAAKLAVEYSENFCSKRKLNQFESNDVVELCKELVQDWFPDNSNFSF